MMKQETFYRETCLDHGPLAVSHAMPEAQSVAIGIFVDVGSRDEGDAQAGASHALEHMVFKGAGQLDVHQLAERLDDLGGHANAYTSRERTCFHMQVLHESWQEALALLVDMVCSPALPADEWQREREVIYSEMAMVEDSPEDWVMDQHLARLYPGQSLGRPVLGFRETLANLSADDLRAFRDAWYEPGRMLVAAAGRIRHGHFVQALDELLAGRAGSPHRHPLRRKGLRQGGVQLLEREGEQAQMVVSWPGICAASDDRPLAWLANQALGGSMSSRLFREVREKRGLAYGIGSHLSMLSDTGTWSVTCGSDPKRAAECADVIAGVLADFPVSLRDEEIERAKKQLEIQFRMGLDAVEGQMLYLGGRLDEERLASPLQWVEKIRAADHDAVREWAASRLQGHPLWTAAAPQASLNAIGERIRISS